MEVPPTSTNLQASRGDEVRCKPSRRKLGGVEVRRTDDDLFFEESDSSTPLKTCRPILEEVMGKVSVIVVEMEAILV